jgi:hypothetical protein
MRCVRCGRGTNDSVKCFNCEVPFQNFQKESIDHPDHYGGKKNPYEAIKIIEAWDLNFNLGNVVKYISRAGQKSPDVLEDLKKARWYIERQIKNLEKE